MIQENTIPSLVTILDISLDLSFQVDCGVFVIISLGSILFLRFYGFWRHLLSDFVGILFVLPASFVFFINTL